MTREGTAFRPRIESGVTKAFTVIPGLTPRTVIPGLTRNPGMALGASWNHRLDSRVRGNDEGGGRE
ncbi:MAG: hypothetical protein CVU17_02650 [Betaproteobacteria bacterium HGW-Betaproteobacteria-11]|nr:MAG: hypothetical protein CVU17_02650 [Betaproteobacteria bacterium HGW-Betaproteobacteria-11]